MSRAAASALVSTEPTVRLGAWTACVTDRARVEGSDAEALPGRILGPLGQGRALYLLGSPGEGLPETADDSEGGVIFDGLLHNRAELLALAIGRSVPTASNADVVWQAYRRLGGEVFRQLKGVFALVVWDRREDVILAVRDPVGAHPLFYADTPRGLVLSTSIQALIHHPDVPDTLNRGALAEHLVGRWERPEETYFGAVRRVPAGHVLRAQGGRQTVTRYWTPPVPIEPRDWVLEAEIARFDTLLEQAVERCVNAGPAAIYLSGGFDSVSIAAVAADIARRGASQVPLALSVVFPDPECNEESIQRGVAESLAIPQIFLTLGEAVPEGTLSAALEMSRGWPVPIVNVWRPAYHRLGTEGAQRGCRVILTGGGGDEWLAVDPLHLADRLRSLDFAGFGRMLVNQLRSHSLPRAAMLRYLLWHSGARPVLVSEARRVLRRFAPDRLSAHYRRKYLEQVPAWVASDRELRGEILQRVEEIAGRIASEPAPRGPHGFYFHGFTERFPRAFQSMMMEEDFEAGRRMGVRILMPYWDVDLIDFLVRMPPELLDRGGRSKGLVRQSMARRFPLLGFGRQRKVTATDFYRTMMQREGPAILRKVGRPTALIDLGVVDGKRIAEVLAANLTSERLADLHRAWQVLNLEVWVRAHA